MQSIRSVAFGENYVTLGCFAVGGRTFALDVTQLREVIRWQPVTPLPNAPILIEGVIDVRGAVVPVVDLGRALGGDPVEGDADARIAIADVEGLVMGLVVEAAIEVRPVEVSALDDPPALVTQTGYDLTRAIVRRPGAEPILVLSLEHLLESVYRSALAPMEEGT